MKRAMKIGCLSGRNAAALPLVLWAVFVMSTVVVVTLGLVDFDLDLESLAGKRFTARQAALTGLAYAQHPAIERGDPLLWQTLPDGTRLEVRLESEDARLNINSLLGKGDATALVKLFRHWGVSEEAAMVAADSLKDWVDADDFRSLNGAEAADLPEGGPYARPENRPFLQVAEMKRVKGMEAVALAKPDWMEFFSVRSSNRLDLQDVSADLLEVFGMLSPDQAAAVVTFRNGPDGERGSPDDPQIESVEALAAIVPLSEQQLQALKAAFGSGSQIRRIISRGVAGGMKHEISVVSSGEGGGRVLEWVER